MSLEEKSLSAVDVCMGTKVMGTQCMGTQVMKSAQIGH
jgi:hypothetical protein